MSSLQRFLAVAFFALTPGAGGGADVPAERNSVDHMSGLSSREAEECGKIAGECRGRFSTWATAHFVVVHETDGDSAGAIGKLLDRTYERFYRCFRDAGPALKAPADRLVWVVFSRHAQFDAYAISTDRMDMSQLDGYYSARTNRVAVVGLPARRAGGRAQGIGEASVGVPSVAGYCTSKDQGGAAGGSEAALDGERFTHEAAHQLAFNSGLQKRGVMYPLWVSEGIATGLEAGEAASEGGGGAVGRQRVLGEAVSGKRLMPLGEFVTLTRVTRDDPRVTDEELYAQSWGFLHFVAGQYGPGLKRYLTTLAQLPPGPRDERTLEREFVAAFGPVQQMERGWAEFLRDCREPSKAAGRQATIIPDAKWFLCDKP